MPYHFDVDRHRRLLEKVTVPPEVKCKVCKKIRMQSAFSKRQLDEVRSGIAYGHTNGITGDLRARCRQCVGQQTVELTCCVCDTTKALQYFSKNQRRDPDNARCTNCVQGHLDTDPISEENRQMIEDESHLESSTYRSQTGDFGLESLRTLSIGDDDNSNGLFSGPNPTLRDRLGPRDITSCPSTYSGDDEDEDQDDDDDKTTVAGDADGDADGDTGVWVDAEPRNRGLSFTAYDINGVAHTRTASRAPSSIASGASGRTGWESWGVVPSARARNPAAANASPGARRNPGFAKIPAANYYKKSELPNQCVEEPKGSTIESDDEEDDDDDIANYI